MGNVEHFANGEADEWHRRNKSKLDQYDLATDALGQAIIASGIKPSFIVDMGCASGKRLIALCRWFKVHGMGVDLSAAALADARKSENSIVTWKLGDLDEPLGRPLVNGLIIYSFVLHWADRPQVLRTFASWFSNAAYIAISDFYPKEPERRHYHHLPDERVWTFKCRYSDSFLEYGGYEFERIKHEVTQYDVDDRQEIAILRRKV